MPIVRHRVPIYDEGDGDVRNVCFGWIDGAAKRDSVELTQSMSGATHDGRLTAGQGQLFYAFHLDEVVPADHVVRRIDAVIDLGWIHKELAPFYSNTGRPSIDPVLQVATSRGS